MDKKFESLVATMRAVKEAQAQDVPSVQLSRTETFGAIAHLCTNGWTLVTDLKDKRYANSAIARVEQSVPGVRQVAAINFSKSYVAWKEGPVTPGLLSGLATAITAEELEIGEQLADAAGY